MTPDAIAAELRALIVALSEAREDLHKAGTGSSIGTSGRGWPRKLPGTKQIGGFST
jgi:hypothetical protein